MFFRNKLTEDFCLRGVQQHIDHEERFGTSLKRISNSLNPIYSRAAVKKENSMVDGVIFKMHLN